MLYDLKLSASTPAPRTTRAKALQAAGVRAVCSRLCMQPTQTRSPFARFRTPRHRGPCHHPPRSHGPRPLPSSPPSAKGPPPPPPPPPQQQQPPPPPPRAPLFAVAIQLAPPPSAIWGPASAGGCPSDRPKWRCHSFRSPRKASASSSPCGALMRGSLDKFS